MNNCVLKSFVNAKYRIMVFSIYNILDSSLLQVYSGCLESNLSSVFFSFNICVFEIIIKDRARLRTVFDLIEYIPYK